MAAPRGLIPGQLTDEQLFRPIADGFEKYPNSQFEFVLASAETVNAESKTVEILSTAGKGTLSYDFLILATGSRTSGSTPMKSLSTTEATKDALHDLQTRIGDATTIVVAGAGVTGVEVAGELAFEYGRKKKIILVSVDRCED